MISDFIDGLDKDLQSHRDREATLADEPVKKPPPTKPTANPSAQFDLDELEEYENDKSIREHSGLN